MKAGGNCDQKGFYDIFAHTFLQLPKKFKVKDSGGCLKNCPASETTSNGCTIAYTTIKHQASPKPIYGCSAFDQKYSGYLELGCEDGVLEVGGTLCNRICPPNGVILSNDAAIKVVEQLEHGYKVTKVCEDQNPAHTGTIDVICNDGKLEIVDDGKCVFCKKPL